MKLNKIYINRITREIYYCISRHSIKNNGNDGVIHILYNNIKGNYITNTLELEFIEAKYDETKLFKILTQELL